MHAPTSSPSRTLCWNVFSPELDRDQRVIVSLPAAYDDGEDSYPVVYVHDGQDVLAAPESPDGWPLSAPRSRAILVGIVSDAQRIATLSPFCDSGLGGGDGERYLDFVVDTLKPHVDAELRTRPQCEHTAMLGASLGGLATLVALLRHSDVFGACAAMSPSVSFAEGALVDYVHAAAAVDSLAYLDVGTSEFDLASSVYVERVRTLAAVLAPKVAGPSLWYREILGGTHSGASWGPRVGPAIDFLLSESQHRAASESQDVPIAAAG